MSDYIEVSVLISGRLSYDAFDDVYNGVGIISDYIFDNSVMLRTWNDHGPFEMEVTGEAERGNVDDFIHTLNWMLRYIVSDLEINVELI